MSILFDTNVILDIALARKPFAIESLEALEKAQKTGVFIGIDGTPVHIPEQVIRKPIEKL